MADQQVITEQIEEEDLASPYKPRKSLPQAISNEITSAQRRQEEHNDRVAQILEEGQSDDRSCIL